MQRRDDLIKKLVMTGHLNVPERRELGVVRLSDIVSVVEGVLRRSKTFPPTTEHDRWTPGRYFEAPQIERRSQSFVVVRSPVHVASHASLVDAVRDYLGGDSNLNIDGIGILDDSPR